MFFRLLGPGGPTLFGEGSGFSTSLFDALALENSFILDFSDFNL